MKNLIALALILFSLSCCDKIIEERAEFTSVIIHNYDSPTVHVPKEARSNYYASNIASTAKGDVVLNRIRLNDYTGMWMLSEDDSVVPNTQRIKFIMGYRDISLYRGEAVIDQYIKVYEEETEVSL